MPNPKCKFCGKELKRSEAFMVKLGTKKTYYCNEEEYNLTLAEKKVEEDFYFNVDLLFEAEMCISNRGAYSTLHASLQSLRKTYTREQIEWFLGNNFDWIAEATERKEISDEYGKVRYFIAIMRNHIDKYLKDNPVEVKNEVNKVKNERKEVDFYMAPVKPVHTNGRRAMTIIEQLEED